MCWPKTLIVCSRAAQINCPIVMDMMADHLGQNDVCDAPFPAIWLLPFVFMPSLKQRVRQFRNPPPPQTDESSSRQSVSHRQIIHQQVGSRYLSNSISKIFHSRAGRTQLVDSSRSSDTVAVRELKASSVLLSSRVC